MAVSLWSTVPTGANDAAAASQGVNLGTKCVANVDGSMLGLRYYEQSITTGTVTLRLLSQAGAVLATATHTAVNGQSGWRDVLFATPVELAAGQYFMAHCHLPSTGNGDVIYGSIGSLPLSTARSTAGGEVSTTVGVSIAGNTSNGVYDYGAIATPVSTFNSGNYGIDVIFETGPQPDPIPTSVVAAGARATTVATPTSITLDYPTGLAENDIVFAEILVKPNTSAVTTPANWTLVGEQEVGGGAQGAGTGALSLWLFRRVVPAGGLTGTQAFSLTGSPSTGIGGMRAFRYDATGFDTPAWASTLTDFRTRTTGSTTAGGIGATNLSLGSTDHVVVVSLTPDDQSSTHTFGSITATGSTFGTLIESPATATINANGNDASMHVGVWPVTAGPSSAPINPTITLSSSETGGWVAYRVRATGFVAAGATTLSPTGIASSEAFGTPIITIEGGPVTGSPTGIASAEAFGTLTATVAGAGGLHSIDVADPATKYATVNNDAQPITVANSFRTSETGWSSTGARFYFSAAWIAANRGNVTLVMQGGAGGVIDTAVGARLASAVATQPGSAGWVDVSWSSAVPMTANAKYWIGAFSAAGYYTAYAPVADMVSLTTVYQLQATDGSNLWIGAQSGEDESEFQYNTTTPGWITTPVTGGVFWGVDIIAGVPGGASPTTASPSGIASGEAFGTAVSTVSGGPITAAPTGIPSAEAFGTPSGPLVPLTIAQENALTSGVASRTTWHDNSNQTSMPAFPRSSYYLPGQTAQFSVDYNSAFTAEVWRMGWYGGSTNARKVADLTGTPTNQPESVAIPDSNGATTCAGWSVNLTWAIPENATPGVYWLRLNGSGVSSQLIFTVSDANAKKPVLVMLSEATWGAAYNYYGGKTAVTSGKSLYGSGGWLGTIEDRALCVSYDRPVITRAAGGHTYAMSDNIPTARFLERLGIEVGYTTCEQVDADPTILDGRTIVLVSGHNEYVSQVMYDKFKAISAAGTNLINLAGNDFFWRTRYGTTTRADTGTRGRVMWCYKDTMPGPGGHTAGTPYVDADQWGGTWQDARWANQQDTGYLWGDRFIANGIRMDALQVPFAMKGKPIWRNCAGVQALTTGQTYSFGAGSVGMEWDQMHPNGGFGPPRVALSSTVIDLTNNAADANGQTYNNGGTYTHSAFMAKTPGGGYIFNYAGCYFPHTFDDFHDAGSTISNANARQAMLNVLVDLGATANSTMVTAASLTMPTPVSDVQTDYGVPAGPTLLPSGIASGAAFGTPTVTTTVTTSPAGIASSEAFGTPTLSAALTASPAGIGTGAAVGAPVVSTALTATASGISSAAAFGTPAVSTALTASPGGVATGEALGTPTSSGSLVASPAGISSAEGVGTPAVSGSLTASPSGIPSAAAVGTPTLTFAVAASPTGIPSGVAFGTPSATAVLTATADGIPSAAAVGTPVLTFAVTAVPSGIPSGAAVGTPTIVPAATSTPTGIPSAEAVGSPTATVPTLASPAGIPSAVAFGTPVASSGLVVGPSGIPGAAAVGTPVATTTLTATAAGIASAVMFGTPSAVILGADSTASPVGIPSGAAVGTPTLTGSTLTSPSGIPTAEQFGTPTISAGLVSIPTGVASTEAFGNPSAEYDIVAEAESILSAEAFGTTRAVVGLLGAPVPHPAVAVTRPGGSVVVQPYAGSVRVTTSGPP